MLRGNDSELLIAAREIVTALSEMGLAPTVIGGVAVSLMTQSRHTDDVDVQVVFDTSNASNLLDALAKKGFQPRFSGMAELAEQARIITVRHETTGTVVDIALACMPFEQEVQERATVHKALDGNLRLPTPEDLVILKAIASRPKDLEDIRNIALTYPDMDRKRIERWVREYGDLLESPDLWQQIRPLLDG